MTPVCDQRADHDEQAHEEDQRLPLDVLEELLRSVRRRSIEAPAPSSATTDGLQVQRAVQDERGDHDGEHQQQPTQQPEVGDRFTLVQGHHPATRSGS